MIKPPPPPHTVLFFFITRRPARSTLFPYTTLFRSIPMLCVTIFVILVVWFLLPRVARTIRPISRSEERFSRNAETDLVCRLLLEKKKKVQLIQAGCAIHTDVDLRTIDPNGVMPNVY